VRTENILFMKILYGGGDTCKQVGGGGVLPIPFGPNTAARSTNGPLGKKKKSRCSMSPPGTICANARVSGLRHEPRSEKKAMGVEIGGREEVPIAKVNSIIIAGGKSDEPVLSGSNHPNWSRGSWESLSNRPSGRVGEYDNAQKKGVMPGGQLGRTTTFEVTGFIIIKKGGGM